MSKSFHDRIAAVVAGQKVEELKARHAYLHGVNRGREEYGTFWLRSDNSTFGHTFGRMMGYKELVPAHFGAPLAANAFAKSDEKYGMNDDDMKDGMPFENATEQEVSRPTERLSLAVTAVACCRSCSRSWKTEKYCALFFFTLLFIGFSPFRK